MGTINTDADGYHPMVAQIMGSCHVGKTKRDALRHYRAAFRKGAWRKFTRELRREHIQLALLQHQRNIDEYRQVMGGH
jgi:hypothetical protein